MELDRYPTTLAAHLAWPRLIETEDGDFGQAVSRLARYELRFETGADEGNLSKPSNSAPTR